MQGEPVDLKNFLEGSGISQKDLIQLPDNKTVSPKWFTICLLVFLMCLGIIVFYGEEEVWNNIAFLIGIVDALCASVFTYHKCKSSYTSILVLVGSIIILLVAVGIVTPKDIRDKTEKYLDNKIENVNKS